MDVINGLCLEKYKQYFLKLEITTRTNITGHLSRTEMYAKEVLSDVLYGAAVMSMMIQSQQYSTYKPWDLAPFCESDVMYMCTVLRDMKQT